MQMLHCVVVNYMTLAWLIVLSREAEYVEENIALDKVTRQSSTYIASRYEDSGHSFLAVDGNANPNYHSHPCSHTTNGKENSPWWMVDLDDVYVVHSVQITNRGNAAGHRLNNFNITMSRKVEADNITLISPSNCNHFQEAAVADSATVRYPCPAPVYARYVKIQILRPSSILTLCEVRVWGRYQALNTCLTYFGLEGRMVLNMFLSSSRVTSIIQCFTDCLKTPNCASFNTQHHPNSSLTCELLENIRETKSTDVTISQSWRYFRSLED